jgi:SWI/SNF-related matrix-associated actin-dependent regulator 1 of chromatin subfamily A
MLFPHQTVGVEFLKQNRLALLADEMGLGKSAQSIVAADAVGAERILVLCPAVARINWLREFQKFSKYSRKWTLIEGIKDCPTPHGSAVSSYDLASRNGKNWPGNWDCLVLDEVHYLKSIDAKRAKAVLGKEAGLVHRAKRIWALSGTPAPNHAGELWPLLRVFGVTPLSYDAFVQRYCDFYDSGYGLKISGTKKSAIPELRQLLARVMLRRRKSEVLKDLPSLFFSTVTVEPGHVDVGLELSRLKGEQARLAEALSFSSIEALQALSQSVSTLRRYNGLRKVAPVAELVEAELELGLYEKIVIFAIHVDAIEGLAKKLARFHPVVVTGSTPASARQAHVDAFQSNPDVRIFTGNIQAAGTNLTLTAAHHVLFLEQDWVPGNNAQAAARCHRIGQTSSVTVRFVSLSDPLDERVTEIVEKKTSELTDLFDCGY